MKRALVLALIAGLPILASAASDINVNIGSARIQSGSTTITFGDRDRRGYYWDGNTWRDPVYWEKHHGKGRGNPNAPGQNCPPGQAKKGNC